MSALLLGEDGLGYELAKKLESHGVWKTWLGDSLYYSTFIHFLSSPNSWNTFMRTNNHNSDDKINKIQLQLQLRVRALLFDKAAAVLYTPVSSNHTSTNISNLNPNYLELHGDDVYFTFENATQDGPPDQQRRAISTSSKGQYKTSNNNAGELPETWYTQFFDKYRASKSYRLMFSDRESEKRTPEQMSTYLRVLENHKRRRLVFKDNSSNQGPNMITGDTDVVDDKLFFPETMFTLNCVPDGAVLRVSEPENNQKMQLNGIFDSLPPLMTKSPMINPIMIERLGIRPEYLNMEQQGHQNRGKNNGFEGKMKLSSQEQATKMSQKVIARLLANVGFESSSVAVTEILGQLLTCHITKLGGKLKLLSDSYRKQCSAVELLKMFLQTSGYRNLGPLVELVKDNTRSMSVQQNQQVHGILSAQLQQPTLQQPQQNLIRQMSPQMQQQQMNNPQYVAFQQLQQQQQLERMRRRQQQLQQQQLLLQQHQQQSITPRPAGMNPNIMNNMDNDNRPLVQVKMEKSEVPLDANNTFTGVNSRHPQVQQLRQQQLAAISSMHAQANNNSFRQMNSVQLQQMQSINMGMARAQPVKVEGFQELMGGGDSSMKHDSDDNKLLSPK